MKILITGGSGFIGTNLIEGLLNKGYTEIVNLDKAKPLNSKQNAFWVEGNIMNFEQIRNIFQTHQPEVVIHLAARTDTLSSILSDYDENMLGTKHVLDAIQLTPTVKRSIITSTQYVYKSLSKPFPDADNEYVPHTVYGKSKEITEEYTRKANLSCMWTIIRPSNIWGPWHMRYPQELWKMIDKGLYFYPGNKPVVRTYGYVGNIVHQYIAVMEASQERIDKKTFYVGDSPIDSFIWLNTISKQLKNKELSRLPIFFFQGLSFAGDILRMLGIKFPLYAERFHNMIEDYYAPTNITVAEFGVANNNIEENVAATIKWIKTEGKPFFEYWKSK